VLVTATAVGYGDQVPATPLGKLTACFAMLTGVIGVAAIISIVGAEMAQLRRPAAVVQPSSVAPLVAPRPVDAPHPDREALAALERRLERIETLLSALPNAERVPAASSVA